MKDLSYLDVFDNRVIREAKRILEHGITAADIDEYLAQKFKRINTPQIPGEQGNHEPRNLRRTGKSP